MKTIFPLRGLQHTINVTVFDIEESIRVDPNWYLENPYTTLRKKLEVVLEEVKQLELESYQKQVAE